MCSPRPWHVPPGKDRAIIDANGNFIALFASAADANAAALAMNAPAGAPARDSNENSPLETSLRELLGIFDMIEAPNDNAQIAEARALIAQIDARRQNGGAA